MKNEYKLYKTVSIWWNSYKVKFYDQTPSPGKHFIPDLQKLFLSIILPAFLLSGCTGSFTDEITPYGLKCEYANNPIGIEAPNPRLSWMLHSEARGQNQSAYQVLVASSLDKLDKNEGDIWDSRKTESENSLHIPYQGKAPESGGRYYWKVCVWDQEGQQSVWSEPSFWEMGLLSPEDWQAKWIAYENSTSAPLFRKEFNINKTIKEARVYISGPGYYELSLNGTKVGDHVLDPGQTDYEKRTFYVVYDVTNQLKQGSNAIGVILGNGWYHQTAVNHGRYGWEDVDYGLPRLICQVHLTFSDGSRDVVLSDETWKASPGPVISNNIYAGEQYDARLEINGWNTSGFNESDWDAVRLIDGSGGKLVCQAIPPIKRIKSIAPVQISSPKPGIYIYDMGQNFSGWAKLKVAAPKGTEIQLRFAECLGDDGMIDTRSTGVYATGVEQIDKYICKGEGIEIWEPRFTYHGFRYMEMTGFPGIPSKENMEGVVVNTLLEKTGDFECSDSMINRLHQTALWTMTSNMHSIPTDCPHRERCGWLGDAFLISDMVNFNFDAPLFWSKFIGDIETSLENGIPSNIAPGRRFGGIDPDWGTAFIKLPWTMLLYYNDTSIIASHYDEMKFFMDHLEEMADDFIIYRGIGSLFPPGRIMPLETPKEFTTTALFYFCSEVMSRMAVAVGEKEDAERYASLSQKIKPAFNDVFYNPVGKTYGGQEKNVLALAFGLAPENDELLIARSLNRDVIETQNGHIATGIFGSRYIEWVLGKYGYGETLMNMLHKETFPGFGYLFSLGATTFWENWGEKKFEDRKSDGDSRSKSHPFQGGFTAWLYNGICGINPDPENPGFKHILLNPQFITGLTYAKANYNSMYGSINSGWQIDGNKHNWDISIPANTTASVYIPVQNEERINEGALRAGDADNVRFIGNENGFSVFAIGSGDYSFSWENDTN